MGGINAWAVANRSTIGTGFLALSLLGNLGIRSFHSPLLLLTWTALAIGVLFTGVSIGNRKVFRSLVALLAFHAFAIPGSILWGTGNWELTAGVVIWMAPALLLYLAKDAQRIFVWLTPAFLAHAGLTIYQGLNNYIWDSGVLVRSGAADGLANNANLSAGFLVIGIIYLQTSPRPWLSLPLLIAVVFTGSRWGLMVAGLLLLIMALTGAISWRPLLGAVAAMVVGVLLLGLFAGSGYRVAGYGSITAAAHAAQTDIGVRLAVPHIPSFLPNGVAEHPGLHNVPLRIAVENGLLAAGLWIVITGWALGRGWLWFGAIEFPILPFGRVKDECTHCQQSEHNGHTPSIHLDNNDLTQHERHNYDRDYGYHPISHRWILLALVLLSLLDYYTWMGHLGGFWWLLIGLLAKKPSAG